MIKKILILCVLFLLTCLPIMNANQALAVLQSSNQTTSTSQSNQSGGKGQSPPYIEGEVLVKFKADVAKSERSSLLGTLNMQMLKQFPRMGVYHLKLTSEDTVPEAIKRLLDNPAVLYAEPNYIRYLDSNLPNDPLFDDLWGLHNTGQTGGASNADIDAPEAWDITTGSTNKIVCVVDTGVMWNHEDLKENMWKNELERDGTPGVDDDGNGYVDDIYGINAITGSGDPMDDHSHGTHCSGTIAAVGNNGIGIAGVNWMAKIMSCKSFNSDGKGEDVDHIECIEYAINKGADVISASWGGGAFSQALKDTIEDSNSAGILFVAAAGNGDPILHIGYDTDLQPHYPASYDNDNIITVAATANNDDLTSFSNYGLISVDAGAPGVDILSTINDGNYDYKSGTSMATPHVSGLAALAMAAHLSETHLEIKTRILRGTDLVPSLLGKMITGGRINAYETLTATIVGPHIYYIDPPYGDTGSSVKLVGDNFGNIQGSGFVTFFDSREGTVISWSDAEIQCEVPVGVDTGPVTVTTDEGTSNGVFLTVPLCDAPGESPYGLASDGTSLWNVDRDVGKIFNLDFYGVVQGFISAPGDSSEGLTFDGEYLWVSDWVDQMIYKIDPASGEVLDSFTSPGPFPKGLAYDGTYLWNADAASNTELIYQLDASGNVIHSCPTPGHCATGLAFDGTYLWNADWCDDMIYQLDPTSCQVLYSFPSPGPASTGLTFDGSYLYNADVIEDKIYRLCIRPCDVNRNDTITPQDALCVFQKYLGICPTDCGPCESICGDVDQNGIATPGDALCIFNEYLGIGCGHCN